tara:strand:+ start:432 stop:911 length:480 start_codon:yes stop_codon:yes gene_type:complete
MNCTYPDTDLIVNADDCDDFTNKINWARILIPTFYGLLLLFILLKWYDMKLRVKFKLEYDKYLDNRLLYPLLRGFIYVALLTSSIIGTYHAFLYAPSDVGPIIALQISGVVSLFIWCAMFIVLEIKDYICMETNSRDSGTSVKNPVGNPAGYRQVRFNV